MVGGGREGGGEMEAVVGGERWGRGGESDVEGWGEWWGEWCTLVYAEGGGGGGGGNERVT